MEKQTHWLYFMTWILGVFFASVSLLYVYESEPKKHKTPLFDKKAGRSAAMTTLTIAILYTVVKVYNAYVGNVQ